MKKIALFVCIASLFSGVSLASGKYTSNDGNFVVSDVNADDKTFYDSVTLQLNFGNGTFLVVNAKEKSPTLFDRPLEPQVTVEGFTIGFLGCEKSGMDQITCYLQVVNNEADREVAAIARYPDPSADNAAVGSILFDNLNNTYIAQSVTFTNITDDIFVKARLYQDIPVKLSMVFTGININASSILLFRSTFNTSFGKHFVGTFKNIKF
ncbi:MAG: hypothetical protein HOP02_03160 [Methylococcaceae bacterium]|nr:hypothetical protein [Methylococcaceae bacterium]